MKPVRLFTSRIPSGNVYKVELLLAQLGVTVETAPLDILANPPETRRADFLAKNPNGRVPVLELSDGSFLSESNAILCFLAEGTEFMPRDAFERAKVLEWLFFEQYSHEPYVAVLKFWTYWGGLDKCDPRDLQRWRECGQAALEVMEQRLGTRHFLVGERYSIADIALFAYTQSAQEVGYNVGPALKAWLSRVRSEPHHLVIHPHC
jgi:glutathione S-transferase